MAGVGQTVNRMNIPLRLARRPRPSTSQRSRNGQWHVLDLGPVPVDGRERWDGDPRIVAVTRVQRPAPSGRRMGSRVLGLGVDALRVAARGRFVSPGTPIIAMNPWTTFAARLLGLSRVATVGLYAVEGGRSWRMLRTVIGSRPVVTLSDHEASRWRSAGGRAVAVRYGSTFPEIPRSALEREDSADRTRTTHVFAGGSSDRDAAAIEALAEQVGRDDSGSLRLVVAVGDRSASDTGRVRRVTEVSPSAFSRLVAESDVVYLPLTDNGRAVGHMVLVEALQRGKPVVATWVTGMDEYFDGRYVRRAESDLLQQLVEVAASFRGREADVQDFWRANYSSEAFGKRVLDGLDSLRAMSPR
jgi:hypothetical protein